MGEDNGQQQQQQLKKCIKQCALFSSFHYFIISRICLLPSLSSLPAPQFAGELRVLSTVPVRRLGVARLIVHSPALVVCLLLFVCLLTGTMVVVVLVVMKWKQREDWFSPPPPPPPLPDCHSENLFALWC